MTFARVRLMPWYRQFHTFRNTQILPSWLCNFLVIVQQAKLNQHRIDEVMDFLFSRENLKRKPGCYMLLPSSDGGASGRMFSLQSSSESFRKSFGEVALSTLWHATKIRWMGFDREPRGIRNPSNRKKNAGFKVNVGWLYRWYIQYIGISHMIICVYLCIFIYTYCTYYYI